MALHEAATYARPFLEASLDPVMTISREAVITDVNEATVSATGVRPERLIGSDFCSYFTDPEQARKNCRLVFSEGHVRDSPLVLRHISGRLADVLCNGSLYHNKKGQVEDAFIFLRDVSERRRVEHILEQQTELLNLAHDAILVWKYGGPIQYWNSGAQVMYGWEAQQAIGKVSHDLFHTKFPIPLDDMLRTLENDGIWEGELRQFTRSGDEIIAESRWSLQRDAQGAPKAVMEINRDITNRRRAEQKLAAERQNFHTILDSLPPYVILLTPDYHVAFANREFITRFGESGGRRCYEFLFNRTEPCELCDTYTVLKSNQPHDWEWTGPDGRNYEIHDFPFTDSEGSKLILEMGIDVTQRKQAEEDIKRLNRELEVRVEQRTAELRQSNSELEGFAYSVSHDLRAPLRHLDGFLSLLIRRTYASLDEQGRHYIDCALEASRRMGRLIDELLQFSRLGRATIHKAMVDINAVIDDVRKELEPEIHDRQIVWHVAKLPPVAADPVMIRQVMENLLGNALKFTRKRQVAEISIGTKAGDDKSVVIFIEDNGAGFDMRYYDKLFQVFQRLHGEEEFEGTGIGLANVRRMVERHGGTVWAEGVVGQGAKFFFSLPG